MRRNTKILAVAVAAFLIGLVMNNFALSSVPSNFSVAVVDIPKIVTGSAQIASLNAEQKSKLEDLSKFVENAKNDLAKESDATKKSALEAKYNKELIAKKEVIDGEYSKKLAAIDKSITEIIKEKAQKKNYDLVLVKGSVIVGGTDITEEILTSIK